MGCVVHTKKKVEFHQEVIDVKQNEKIESNAKIMKLYSTNNISTTLVQKKQEEELKSVIIEMEAEEGNCFDSLEKQLTLKVVDFLSFRELKVLGKVSKFCFNQFVQKICEEPRRSTQVLRQQIRKQNKNHQRRDGFK